MAIVIQFDWSKIEWTVISLWPNLEFPSVGSIHSKLHLRSGSLEMAYECYIPGESLRAFIADLHALQRGKPAPAVLHAEEESPGEVLWLLPPVHPDADIRVRFAWGDTSWESIPQPEAYVCPYGTDSGPSAGFYIYGQGLTMNPAHLPALIDALEDLMLEYDATADAMRRESP